MRVLLCLVTAHHSTVFRAVLPLFKHYGPKMTPPAVPPLSPRCPKRYPRSRHYKINFPRALQQHAKPLVLAPDRRELHR